jgi:hypothetical protein
MKHIDYKGIGGTGLPMLLSVCRWGRRFYAEAAEVSQDSQQTLTLQNLELQRTLMVEELLKALEPGDWAAPPFIPMLRAQRENDQAILKLCADTELETIEAYQREIAIVPPSAWKALLEAHLAKLVEGQARLMALLKAA